MNTTAPHLTFEPTEEEALLRSSLRQVLTQSNAREAGREFWERDADFDRRLWTQLTELGIAGMAAPDAPGEAGAPYAHLALVSEELGHAAAVVPFEMHSVALRLLGALAQEPATTALVNAAAAGERVLTAALPSPAVPEGQAARLTRTDAGLSGRLSLVLEGAVADAVIVPTAPAGLTLLTDGWEREHVASLGMNRLANLSFANAAAVQHWPETGAQEQTAHTLATLLFAARQAGMGEWMLQQSTEYAASRVQFGRAIGSFQAIQHKLAEMHIALSAGRFLVRYAASGLDAGTAGHLDVARAKAYLDTALWQTGADAHQIHGGVGFVLDHPLHLYFAQSRGAEAAFGGPRAHHREIGRALLEGADFRPNLLLSS